MLIRLENNNTDKIKESKISIKSYRTIRVATSAILIAVGLVLSYLNPFAYFTLFGTKINPFAHLINAISGVLLGTIFALVVALGIAILRFSLGIGTIHAFHGGMSGALVVGLVSRFLWHRKIEKVEIAAFFEPLGTVFIGGTIAYLIAPFGGISVFEGLLIYWGLFAASCIPGSILGYIILIVLKRSGISRENFIESPH